MKSLYTEAPRGSHTSVVKRTYIYIYIYIYVEPIGIFSPVQQYVGELCFVDGGSEEEDGEVGDDPDV
jgi:hypothetical protein